MSDTAHAVKGQTARAWYPSTVVPLPFNDVEDGMHDVIVHYVVVGQAKPAQASQDLIEVVRVWLVGGYAPEVSGEPGINRIKRLGAPLDCSLQPELCLSL